MNSSVVKISKKGLLWLNTGHPWVYRDDLLDTGSACSGDIVDVIDYRGKYRGKAFFGKKSKISLRLLTRDEEPVIGEAFWRERIRKAVERRGLLAEKRGALRLVYSEGDGLPGLIADSYSGWLVLQALVPGVDARIELIADIFGELLAPKGIVCRNDAHSRTLEGLPIQKKMLRGEKPGPIEVREGAVRYLVDVWEGHKTGAYIDQSENRILLAGYARGSALDCFSYQGHFALQMASNAEAVTAIESSKPAVAMMERNCVLNDLKKITPVQGNAFDLLRRYHRGGKRFDTIVLDPPPLARKKSHIEDALRGYKEINLRAMHLLAQGGVLASFCCSHSIPRGLFLEVLRESAADARCLFRVMEELGQALDHPVLLNVPETGYLKGFILKKE